MITRSFPYLKAWMFFRSALAILAWTTLLTLLMVGVSAAEEISFTVSPASPIVGDTVTVTMNLSNAAGFANWGALVTFDKTRLALKQAGQATGSFTTFVSDARSNADINASGESRVGGFGFANNAGGNGSLGIFAFTAIASGIATISTAGKSNGQLFGTVLVDADTTERAPGLPLTTNIVINSAVPPASEIVVIRDATDIADGGADVTMSSVAGSGASLSYSVKNIGTAVLTLGSFSSSAASNCTVVVATQPAASVAAGASSTLVLSVTPTAVGAWSVVVSGSTNDTDEDPANWTISGTATGVSPPATVATPTFTPAPGSYGSAQSVTIACGTAGATIHYTKNGSTPTASSAVYTGAISVSRTITINAIASASGMTDSRVASAAYTITQVDNASTNHPFAASMNNDGGGCGLGGLGISGLMFMVAMMIGLRSDQYICRKESPPCPIQ